MFSANHFFSVVCLFWFCCAFAPHLAGLGSMMLIWAAGAKCKWRSHLHNRMSWQSLKNIWLLIKSDMRHLYSSCKRNCRLRMRVQTHQSQTSAFSAWRQSRLSVNGELLYYIYSDWWVWASFKKKSKFCFRVIFRNIKF